MKFLEIDGKRIHALNWVNIFRRGRPRKPIVFLHIPKTAGQTIFHQIAARVGIENVCPIRDLPMAEPGETHLPPGYAFYGGHINWHDIDQLEDPFSFTVLRDPRERIGSLYFYLLQKSREKRDMDSNLLKYRGEKLILELSADDYFFGNDLNMRINIAETYDNFYTSYFATRRVRGAATLKSLSPADKISLALKGAAQISSIYTVDRLIDLESDLRSKLGSTVSIVGNINNQGPHKGQKYRWKSLVDLFEKDCNIRRMEAFVAQDLAVMEKLTILKRI
ncbi:sulfotransferase family 2 domain-containing protein [Pararhodobacter sp. CCB-MM2]|uniref:sulfotransferase family 2 domain-containing protein n=1 Tax=Pararhodobacter sp. CCB-MM2 TaxID=1786003 RepID=UPI000AD2E02A|nr:sulfotransferase family 2 domain-containing protein [Pararhodobacter sp. CCB-MM2]